MICNQCGKNNLFGVKECTYCGAPMPSQSACGGFSDILSYQPPAAKAGQDTQTNPPLGAAQPQAPLGVADGSVSPREAAGSRPQKTQQWMLYALIGLFVISCILGICLGTSAAKQKELEAQNQALQAKASAPNNFVSTQGSDSSAKDTPNNQKDIPENGDLKQEAEQIKELVSQKIDETSKQLDKQFSKLGKYMQGDSEEPDEDIVTSENDSEISGGSTSEDDATITPSPSPSSSPSPSPSPTPNPTPGS